MSYETQIEVNKVKETFIGIGIGIGLYIFYTILNWGLVFFFQFLIFRNNTGIENFVENESNNFIFMGLGIAYQIFWLFVLIYIIWWYASQKNRKFVALGIGIAIFGLPLLIFGGCLLVIFGLGGLDSF